MIGALQSTVDDRAKGQRGTAMNTQVLKADDVPIDSSDSDCLVEKTHGHRLIVQVVSERHRVPHGSRPLI